MRVAARRKKLHPQLHVHMHLQRQELRAAHARAASHSTRLAVQWLLVLGILLGLALSRKLDGQTHLEAGDHHLEQAVGWRCSLRRRKFFHVSAKR